MSKEILLIYQDCPYCAPREEWGEQQKQIAKDNGFNIKEVYFNTPSVKRLIQKAQSRGVKQLPFFTDTERFTYNLQDFVHSKPKSVPKATKEAKAEVKNGDSTKD